LKATSVCRAVCSPWAALPVLLLVFLAGGCPEPDLGVSPFLCNPGQPQCPEGYTCVTQGGIERCVKEGHQPPADSGPPDAAMADAEVYPDWPRLPDRYPSPDSPPPVKWDGQPKPDLPKPGPDGWPPHLGCQSNTECQQADPSAPCCCPFLLGVWTCLPLCPDPLCF
jgi:hypothetical protein